MVGNLDWIEENWGVERLPVCLRSDNEGRIEEIGVSLQEGSGSGEGGEFRRWQIDGAKLVEERFLLPLNDASRTNLRCVEGGDTRTRAFFCEAIAKVGEKSFGIGSVDNEPLSKEGRLAIGKEVRDIRRGSCGR